MRRTVRLPMVLCPHCGHTLDAHTQAVDGPGTAPVEGDFGLCVGCWSPLVFGDDLKLRPATQDEAAELPEWIKERIVVMKITAAVNEAIFGAKTPDKKRMQ